MKIQIIINTLLFFNCFSLAIQGCLDDNASSEAAPSAHSLPSRIVIIGLGGQEGSEPTIQEVSRGTQEREEVEVSEAEREFVLFHVLIGLATPMESATVSDDEQTLANKVPNASVIPAHINPGAATTPERKEEASLAQSQTDEETRSCCFNCLKWWRR